MREIIVDKQDAKQRLNKYLMRLLPAAGESFLYRMLRKKNILLNGGKANGNEIVEEGDALQIYFSEETFAKFAGHAPATKTQAQMATRKADIAMPPIIFENEVIVIVDKPAGMMVQPDASGEATLADALCLHYRKQEGMYRPAPLHRLDRNTSGLVLCAKTLHAAQLCSALIKERQIQKRYLALAVCAEVEEGMLCDHWTAGRPKVRITAAPTAESVPVETRIALRLRSDAYALLDAELISGKKHQIRAQCAAHGMPLVADPLYGNDAVNRMVYERFGVRRQMLHAAEIVFPETDALPSDLSGKRIAADLPRDMQTVLEGLGFEKV